MSNNAFYKNNDNNNKNYKNIKEKEIEKENEEQNADECRNIINVDNSFPTSNSLVLSSTNNTLTDLLTHIIELQARLEYIEQALAPANILKITPITSMIYKNDECKSGISKIYRKWVAYMNYVSETGITSVMDTFFKIDYFIFEQYFQEKFNNGIYFIQLGQTPEETVNMYKTDKEQYIISKAIEGDRDQLYNFKCSADKEYVSTLYLENNVYIIYNPWELNTLLLSSSTSTSTTCSQNKNKNKNKNTLYTSYPLHDNINLDKNIIGPMDSNVIGITARPQTEAMNAINTMDATFPSTTSGNLYHNQILQQTQQTQNTPQTQPQPQTQTQTHTRDTHSDSHTTSLHLTPLDMRSMVIGTQRPLYNTIVDTGTLNEFNCSLYGFGSNVLDITLVLVHAMCHLKCDIETNNLYQRTGAKKHGYHFVKQFVNFVPSALYGHRCFPLLTIS